MEFLPGFEEHTIEAEPGIRIRAYSATPAGGHGVPVLLLHGHPQTSATWHSIAPALARDRAVVAMDLRGYGASSKPPSGGDHATYAKRAMARDAVAVMRALGHDRFALVGHDRGGRVAHRLALDHPQAVDRIAVFDIAPTLHMYERTDRRFAERYFWWFFLIQPEPLPERLIAANPEFFLRHHLKTQSKTEAVPSEAIIREYLRAYDDPVAIHAICEDYRAAASIDLVHDRADRDARRGIEAPLLALWGSKGTVGQLYDVLQTWCDVARDVRGKALDCGHFCSRRSDPTRSWQSCGRS